MPRRPIIHYEGATYHVMARGIDGRAIFATDAEKGLFYDCLGRVKRAKDFQLFAHALMPNHFHLVVQVLQSRLSEIMRLIQTRFAVVYNTMHDRQGHVFQGRYKPLPIEDNAYLMAVIRYVHLNPVAGRLVSLPEHWQWSGHNEILGLTYPRFTDTAFPLGLFGDSIAPARRRYLDFVYAKLSDLDLTLPSPPELPGQEGVLALNHEASRKRPSLQELANRIESKMLLPSGSLSRRGREGASARRDLMREAFANGYCVTEIARHLAVSVAYVSKTLSESA